jgi:hypothetical protein
MTPVDPMLAAASETLTISNGSQHPHMLPIGPFTIQALESAINRARQTNPAEGAEARLSPEVAKLAALYGWMIYEGRQELSPDLLNADEMEILARWMA